METPCTGVCRIDRKTRQCEGCLRTIDEISNWAAMSEGDRTRLIQVLKVRQSLMIKSAT